MNPQTGAFRLGAPGVYVREEAGRLVVGTKPGAALAVAGALLLLVALSGAGLFWNAEPVVAMSVLAFFALPLLLALLNTQRFLIERGLVRRGGRALGKTWPREWRLPEDSAVRIDTRVEQERNPDAMPRQWTLYQAQLRVADQWLAIAESADEAQARAFASKLAAAAAVPLARP